MMIDPISFRKQFEDDSLKKIIRERDSIIRDLHRYEKGKIPEEDYGMNPSPETVYIMNNLYLAELCNLIYEKKKEKEDFYGVK